jgi:hypothetical protein
MAVKHAFTSAKSDGADAALVRASNWNASHTIDAGTITAAELAAGIAGSLTAASAALGAQELLANEGGTNKKLTVDQIAAYVGGRLLAVMTYGPTGSGYSTSGTSYADVDATNLAVTFTTPASGNVLVVLSGFSANGAGHTSWGLREATTDIATAGRVNSGAEAVTMTVYIHLTGISAGSHTYKWSWKVDSGSANLFTGSTDGHAMMMVWSAP